MFCDFFKKKMGFASFFLLMFIAINTTFATNRKYISFCKEGDTSRDGCRVISGKWKVVVHEVSRNSPRGTHNLTERRVTVFDDDGTVQVDTIQTTLNNLTQMPPKTTGIATLYPENFPVEAVLIYVTVFTMLFLVVDFVYYTILAKATQHASDQDAYELQTLVGHMAGYFKTFT